MRCITGIGSICVLLSVGCAARQPQIPVAPASVESAINTDANRAAAAAQKAEEAAARIEAASARMEEGARRIEAVVAALEGGVNTSLSEREVRRFKKISTHEHYRAGGNIAPYLAVMKRARIEQAVFVPTGWPPSDSHYRENLKELLALQRQHPKQIIAFATAYNQDPQAAQIIEGALKAGARGIKFIDWLFSERYPNDAGPVDSANMRRVYAVARRYHVPVLLHIDFQKRPDWKQQFDRVAADFPDVTFILAHYCRAASGAQPALELCTDTLDKFANVVVDLSMGGGLKRYMRYFDEDPTRWRNFILHYQDRILWGTDMIVDDNPGKNADWIWRRIRTDFSILQLARYKSPFHQEDQIVHQGLALPAAVLKKIYYDNPKRILSGRN